MNPDRSRERELQAAGQRVTQVTSGLREGAALECWILLELRRTVDDDSYLTCGTIGPVRADERTSGSARVIRLLPGLQSIREAPSGSGT